VEKRVRRIKGEIQQLAWRGWIEWRERFGMRENEGQTKDKGSNPHNGSNLLAGDFTHQFLATGGDVFETMF
jgi:hypothetical protein